MAHQHVAASGLLVALVLGWPALCAAAMTAVFAPFNASVVGLINLETMTLSTVSMGSLTGGGKFFGAATDGTTVFFGPYGANVLGLFNVETKTFSTSVSIGGSDLFFGITVVVEVTCSKLACPPLHLHVAACTGASRARPKSQFKILRGCAPNPASFFSPHIVT